MNLDPSTGEVTGTPTATYSAANVVFSVKDANNVVASTTSTVSFNVDLAASVPPSTGWTTVKMGGGGYVPGIEEMVNLGMAAPPPVAAYLLASAHGDTGLYVHTSLTAAPTRSPNLGASPPLGVFGNGTGIDMAWDDPAYIAAVGTFGTTSNGAYSTNSGVTWTNFQTVPPTASNTGDHSKVAVTADGSNIIWSVEGQIP